MAPCAPHIPHPPTASTSYPPPPPKGAKGKKGQPAVPELSYGYVYKFTPVMERRLQQAGVRLAAYLNDIYAKPLPSEPTR